MRIRVTKEPVWFNRAKTRSKLLHFLGVHRVVDHNPIPPHTLPCWELGLVELGQLDLTVAGRPVRVPAGHFVVVPPRVVIESDASAGMNAGTFYWIGLNPEAARNEMEDAAWRETLDGLNEVLRKRSFDTALASSTLFEAVDRALDLMQDDEASLLAVTGAASVLAGEVHRVLLSGGKAPALKNEGDERIAPALSLIRDPDDWKLPVSRLAKACGMSRATFAEVFRQTSGETPRAFTNRARIARACRLLRGTDLSVTAIAERLGFSSTQYFASAFRKHTGRTPSAYRDNKG
jgi:AraC-like DNA-binding protein